MASIDCSFGFMYGTVQYTVMCVFPSMGYPKSVILASVWVLVFNVSCEKCFLSFWRRAKLSGCDPKLFRVLSGTSPGSKIGLVIRWKGQRF